MGDTYHPPRRRDNRYDDRYSPPPPPPPRRDHYDGYRRDNHRDSGYNFRGASDRTDSYRPPRSDFTFQAGGPPAPRFPPAPRDQPPPSGPRQDFRKGRGGRGGGRGGRGGRPFIPKPAHKRAILGFTETDEVPEEMFGTSEHAKFRDTDSSDDEEDGIEGQAPKRVKTMGDADGAARPQWSNPDPYSVLPPTDVVTTAKKDIVQTIRKRKAEGAANEAAAANSIKDNADFISFNFDDDEPKEKSQSDSDSSEGDDYDFVGAPPPPPSDFVMPSDAELLQTYDGSNSHTGKRKREAEQTLAKGAGLIVVEWLPKGSNMTPWLNPADGFQSNTGLQLHTEIADFFAYVAPRDYERAARLDLIERVQRVVRQAPGGNDVEVRSFGSFASDLYLPTADMDLVAVSRSYMSGRPPSFCQSASKMHKLAHQLKIWKIAKNDNVTVISRAKVPILKFVDAKTDIKVDISFENDSGIRALPTFGEWKRRFPKMPVLVMIIKQFLIMRGLNEVFSGGIGGFTIICLVTSMMQHMTEAEIESTELGYGDLLQKFFDLYGNKFDIAKTGIMMEPAKLFRKGVEPVYCKINPDTLTIVDPNRPENDISGGSRHIGKVFQCFRGAYIEIQRRLHDVRTGKLSTRSILGCILGGNYSSFEEQRILLRALDRSQRPHTLPPPPPTRSMPPHLQQAGYPSLSQHQSQPLPARPPPSQTGTASKGPKRAKTKKSANPAAAPSSGPGPPTAKAKKPKKTKAQKKAAAAAKASSSTSSPPEKTSTNTTKKTKSKKVMEPKPSKNELRERRLAARTAKKNGSAAQPNGS